MYILQVVSNIELYSAFPLLLDGVIAGKLDPEEAADLALRLDNLRLYLSLSWFTFVVSTTAGLHSTCW